MKKQFNPKPGDKIICNNGEEFTCCTLDFVRGKIASHINTNKPIIGYSEDVEWQDWGTDGVAAEGYSIKEVIPQQKEETTSAETADTTVYTKEDIRKACIDDLGWMEYSFGLLMESLEKVKNPEYMEYLRLKAMFESEQQEL